MKKRWLSFMLTGCLLAGVTAAGCGTLAEEENTVVSQMMYLEFGKRTPQVLFADKNGALLDVTIPENALFDEEGELMTQEELSTGDLLKVYGNGIILESDPGQYPGVSKMQRIGQGDPDLAKQYLDDIYQYYYSEPDPAERPFLQIQYRTDMAAVSTAAIDGPVYDWIYLDEEDKECHIRQHAGPVTQWENVYEFTFPKEVDSNGYVFYFDKLPKEVSLTCYLAEEEPQVLPLKARDDGFAVSSLEEGAYYELTARWEGWKYANGTVTYGFYAVTED